VTTRQGARDGRANVCNWPITTFRYAAEFGRCRGHSGHWPAERPTGLWVHGLDISAMGDCNGGLRTEAGLFLILRRTSIKAENKLAREAETSKKALLWHSEKIGTIAANLLACVRQPQLAAQQGRIEWPMLARLEH